jgi:EmrB/QacA subfamily drug resistance transporter
VPELSRRRRLAVLGISCFSLLIVGLDDTVVSIALPTIARGLHASVSGLQWVADGYTMVLASLVILGGATADRFGRRRIFRVGLAVFTVASALCSLAPSLGWLIAFRVLQAAGGSMLNPVAVSIISGVFTGRAQRERAIAVWVGMFGLGMALGPTLGGVLVGTVGWQGIFWVNIPVGICAIVLTSLFVPESRAAAPRRPDPVGQVLVIAALSSLVYAIIEGAYTDWRAPVIRALFIAAGAALAVLAAWELRRRDPLIDPRHFRSRSFTAAVLIGISSFADLGGFLFLASIYLQDARGFSAVNAGLRMLPTAAAMAVCPSLAAWLTARTGSARLPLFIGGLALMLSTNMMARLTGSSADTYLLETFGLFGVGMGMINSQITVAAVAGMPPGQAGLASGIASACRQVGQALGVAVAGSLLTAKAHGLTRAAFTLASHSAWHLLFWCASVVVICGLATTRTRARHAKASARRGRPSQQHVPHPDPQDPPHHPSQTLPQPLPQRSPRPRVTQGAPASPESQSVWTPRSLMNMDRGMEPPADPELGAVFPGSKLSRTDGGLRPAVTTRSSVAPGGRCRSGPAGARGRTSRQAPATGS